LVQWHAACSEFQNSYFVATVLVPEETHVRITTHVKLFFQYLNKVVIIVCNALFYTSFPNGVKFYIFSSTFNAHQVALLSCTNHRTASSWTRVRKDPSIDRPSPVSCSKTRSGPV